jgi:hypothetical protein
MEEKNKTYTALDFARYHAGTMSSPEMHALEKAALEDPFLADALEGYAYVAFPEKDTTEIQHRLVGQPKKKKIFFISSVTQNKWWSVAALFIIIIGIGFVLYRTNNNNNPNTKELLATNSDKKSPEKIEGSSPVLKDSGTVNDNVAFERQEAPGLSLKNKSALSKINEVKEYENINAGPKLKTVKTPGLLSTKEDNPISGNVTTQRSSNKNEASNQYVLKGKITDEIGQAIPFASIEDENQKKITVTDSSGQFALTTPDSNAKVNASALGYASKKDIALQKDKQSIIAMNKKETTLSEVVVTSAHENKHKRALSPSANLQGKVAGVVVT